MARRDRRKPRCTFKRTAAHIDADELAEVEARREHDEELAFLDRQYRRSVIDPAWTAFRPRLRPEVNRKQFSI